MPRNYDTEDRRRALSEALSQWETRRILREDLIPSNRYLGEGAFGVVTLGTWNRRDETGLVNASQVAVKRLHERQETFVRQALGFARELRVWLPIDHPNILRCLGFNIDLKVGEAYFVSPYLSRGSMYDRLRKNHPIDSEQRMKWVVDVTRGLNYLHSLDSPVIHGDLKSLNILLNDSDAAVLCDFGQSSFVEEPISTGLVTSNGFKGTVRWCSPELLEDDEPTPTRYSDIWAWALCVLEIATGKLPFPDVKTDVKVVLRILKQCPTPEEHRELPSNHPIWETLKKCFLKKPEERPSSDDCLIQVSLATPPSIQLQGGWVGSNQSDRRQLAEFLPLHRLRIPTEELQFEDQRLGIGGFGQVLLASWRASPGRVREEENRPKHVAVRWLRLQERTSIRLEIRFAREAILWSDLRHPNVLTCLGYNVDLAHSLAYFVSPYLPGGSLRSRLDKGTTISVEQREKWVIEVTQGLNYLHSWDPPVAHGDLKSGNILLDGADSAILCDFGLSSVVEESLSTGLTTSAAGFGGSLRWCSPELLDGERRTLRSDMWAWALCILEILTGRMPFHKHKSEAAVVRQIVRGRMPSREEYPELPLNSRNWEMLEQCFRMDPEERPSTNDCLIKLSRPNTH